MSKSVVRWSVGDRTPVRQREQVREVARVTRTAEPPAGVPETGPRFVDRLRKFAAWWVITWVAIFAGCEVFAAHVAPWQDVAMAAAVIASLLVSAASADRTYRKTL
jgi:crotonobetainyl-CoA:carnitine CoA-transferase CaiB-like acyl-CoA transferase